LFTVLSLTRRRTLHLSKNDFIFVLVYGFELSLFNALWTLSVYLNGAAVSTVLAYSSAAFTALLGWRFLGERIGGGKALAVLLSLAGCAFVSGAYTPSAWRVNTMGILAGLLSGLAYAIYSLLGRNAAQRKMDLWATLAYTFLFAAIFLLAYNLASRWLPGMASSPGLIDWGGNLAGWLVLLILAVGPTVGGFGFYNGSLHYLPASVANLIATLEPAMTTALAYLLLDERFSGPQALGSALIICGVLLLRITEGRNEPGKTA
jgi:drug/metabolite transporter (DMT)-like permease